MPELREIADQLHEAACTPGCPWPPMQSTSWRYWAERIAAGQTTIRETVAHINPGRLSELEAADE